MYVAGAVGAGKNQGLAGGAIVLGWGVMFGGLAFLISIVLAFKMAHKYVVKANWVLFVLLAIGYGITHYRFAMRDKKDKEPPKETPKKVTAPAETSPTAMLFSPNMSSSDLQVKTGVVDNPMGMGYFIPNYFDNPVLYFYGNLNLEKSLMDHTAIDSITFRRNKYNQFEIATAPAWLVPDIMKLDYDLLYFKVQSVTDEFAEIIVNTTNNRTSFVSRAAGRLLYWPDLLLGVNSIEFPQGSLEKVRNRPFEAAGTNNTPYDFMQPLQIKGDWMYVLLVDQDFNKTGKGWIQWKRDGKLMVRFNLLS
jgi:hypothetical protein